MSWESLLHFSSDYSHLVREFYTTMLHKRDKTPETIISTVKGVRIVLDRTHLATILSLRDAGNMFTVDSKRKTVQEDLDWSYKVTSNRLQIHSCLRDRDVSLIGVIFSTFYPMP